MLIGALVAMATDRTRGWWDEWRGMLPQVTQDVAEAEHHAKFLREVVITYVPGLLQTPEYARAVFTYTRPELLASEVALRVDRPLPTRIAIRDSKNPSHGTLSVPTGSFTAFIEALKAQHPWSEAGPTG